MSSIYIFQSTGSVWSPTVEGVKDNNNFLNFNPRAPCGARPNEFERAKQAGAISIHGLRVEPDCPPSVKHIGIKVFQSTGSVWSPT